MGSQKDTRQQQGSETERLESEGAATADQGGLVVVTMNAATGSLVKIETVEPNGARHEPSAEETQVLARDRAKASLERVIEQAFEAGIACVLGASEEELAETEDYADLRQLLLQSLIEQSAARRLMGREVLNRAILGTIISEAAADAEAGGPVKH